MLSMGVVQGNNDHAYCTRSRAVMYQYVRVPAPVFIPHLLQCTLTTPGQGPLEWKLVPDLPYGKSVHEPRLHRLCRLLRRVLGSRS